MHKARRFIQEMRWKFIAGMIGFGLLPFSSVAMASSETDALLNKLVEKHLLTSEDAQEVRNDMAKDSENRAKAQEVEVKDIVKSMPGGGWLEPKKSAPKTLHDYIFGPPDSLPKESGRLPVMAGLGEVKLGLLLQEWFTQDNHGKDNFRTRRAEMGFTGKVGDHLKWAAVIDPSLVREDNTTRSIMKDMFVAFDGIPHHEVKLGQYKIPLTEEGFRSSALIDTIERSYIARTYSDVRDDGVMTLGNWKYLDYQAGIFNGQGPNKFDTKDQKDVVARIVLKPFPDNDYLKGFQVGSSGYYRVNTSTFAKKKRLGAEAKYEYGPFSVKGEYLTAQDAAVPAEGWYAQLGYFFLPRWQGIAKVEGFDPNKRASNDKEFDATMGLNYFLIYPTTKLQLNYIHKTYAAGGAVPDDNQIVAAAQYAF